MRYMLDTNVCIDLMRGRSATVLEKLRHLAMDDACISSITFAELHYGAVKSSRRAYHRSLIAAFCAPLVVAAFDAHAADVYGTVRANLELAGTPIGPLDTLIAAHALTLGVTIVTANVQEFQRIPGLAVENWR